MGFFSRPENLEIKKKSISKRKYCTVSTFSPHTCGATKNKLDIEINMSVALTFHPSYQPLLLELAETRHPSLPALRVQLLECRLSIFLLCFTFLAIFFVFCEFKEERCGAIGGNLTLGQSYQSLMEGLLLPRLFSLAVHQSCFTNQKRTRL